MNMPSAYDPSRIYPYDELTAQLEALVASHPSLATLVSAGKSHEGRDIWLVELTDASTGAAADKPAVWLDGNTHAAELAGSAVCLHALWHLAALHAAGDAEVRALLAERALYVMPRVNPDGAEHVLRTGVPLRSGTRPWPREERPLPGFVPGDVDGDGRVLQMRVRNDAGAWKEWAKEPRVLIPREAGDLAGPFFDLYREGAFDGAFDPDRLEVPPPRQGLDFNRNYPYGYRPEAKQKGAGPYPLSEPETRAHVEAVVARPRIAAALTFHTYCGAILRPFSDKPDSEMDPADLALFTAVGRVGTALTGYPTIGVFHEFRYASNDVISGAFDDWAYNDRGLLAYTVEIWNIAAQAGVEITDFAGFFFKGRRTPEQAAQVLAWCDAHAPKAWIPWYEVDHPQLGRVELGGWNRLVSWQNPPASWLGPEADKNVAFARALLASLPHLRWKRLVAEREANGLRRIVAAVENTGYLPTSGTRLGKTIAPPVTLRIALPAGCTLVAGQPEVDLGHLEGAADVTLATFSDSVFFGGSTLARVGRAEWWVRGEGPVKLIADGGRAGKIEATVA